jgi:hypothetical protein
LAFSESFLLQKAGLASDWLLQLNSSLGLCSFACAVSLHLQVSTVLQPLMTADPPPTYFKTDMFTNCFQVGLRLVVALLWGGSAGVSCSGSNRPVGWWLCVQACVSCYFVCRVVQPLLS